MVRPVHAPLVQPPVSLSRRREGNVRAEGARESNGRRQHSKPSHAVARAGLRASCLDGQGQSHRGFIDGAPMCRGWSGTRRGGFQGSFTWRTFVTGVLAVASIASIASVASIFMSGMSEMSKVVGISGRRMYGFGAAPRGSSVATYAALSPTMPTSSASPAPMTVVVPRIDDESHVLKATWREVLEHLNRRLSYEDPALRFEVVDLSGGAGVKQLAASKVVYALNIQEDDQAQAILDAVQSSASFVALNSSKILEGRNMIHHAPAPTSGPFSFLARFFGAVFGGNQDASNSVLSTINELYHRRSADDLLYSFLVYFNAATKPVQSIVNSTKRSDAGIKEAMCMVKNCGKEILDCVTDDTCSKGLACLNTCSFNDQVCSYLCIASYESPAFEQFSLCILQRHNCLGLSAEIPANPRAQPMKTFRGAPMTHELAESMFNGWLDQSQETFSWRVFAGMNAAFDRFPCQYQLFFPGNARNTFWYRPIFKVETLEGKTVWRERLYRMRRQPKNYRDDGLPVFRLSVLDNGVVSLEDWTVLSCDERQDGGTPSWCVFSYSGAASKAGMAYYGAILASRDGKWPTDKQSLDVIEDSLDRSGIKMWELFSVDNSQCDDFEPSVTTLPRVWEA